MTTAGSAAAAQPRTARPRVLVQRLDSALPLPAYAIVGDAGADIVTAVDVDLAPGHRAVLPTGIAIALPDGHAAFVHPRSGLAARAGLALVNSPGTIDSGYRGEIKVIVINLDPALPLHLARGERIAQLVIQRVEHAEFVEVDALPASDRGVDGHGSTGGAAALATPSSELDRDPAGPEGGADGAGSGVVAAGAASSDAAVDPEPVGGADGARPSEMATGGALTAPEEGRR